MWAMLSVPLVNCRWAPFRKVRRQPEGPGLDGFRNMLLARWSHSFSWWSARALVERVEAKPGGGWTSGRGRWGWPGRVRRGCCRRR